MIYYNFPDDKVGQVAEMDEFLRILRKSRSMRDGQRFGIMGPFCQNLALILDDSNISALNAIPEKEDFF